MSWIGTWKNQFGSIVEITSEAGGKIEGTFRTALEDSGFYGQTVAILGAYSGDCIGFSSASTSHTGNRAVSYTGLLRNRKMETAWFVVSDKALSAAREGEPATMKSVNWWRAVTTNFDTFERVG
jgi:Avidin family